MGRKDRRIKRTIHKLMGGEVVPRIFMLPESMTNAELSLAIAKHNNSIRPGLIEHTPVLDQPKGAKVTVRQEPLHPLLTGYSGSGRDAYDYLRRDGQGRFLPREETVWRVNDCMIEGCPIAPKPVVYVPHILWQAWFELANDFSTEWLAYLIGERTPTGDYSIREMNFPPQHVSGGHVEVPDGHTPPPGVVGAVHSHVGMPAFWSGTDTCHANWPVEIVVNRKGEYKAAIRVELKCGSPARADGTIKLIGDRISSGFNAQLKAAIQERRPVVQQVTPAPAPVAQPEAPQSQPAPSQDQPAPAVASAAEDDEGYGMAWA